MINLHLVIYLFRLFMEHLLCIRHYSSVGNTATYKSLCSHLTYILLVRNSTLKKKTMQEKVIADEGRNTLSKVG